MKKILLKTVFAVALMAFVTSCEDDDLTGRSTMNPTAPSLSVSLDFDNEQTLVESESTYGFTVSISEPQIARVFVNLSQVGGNATEGDDFSFPHQVVIPIGATSVSGEIAIHADEIIEDTESVTIQIATGAESNVGAINSETVKFNIQNLTSEDLAIHFEWAASELTTDNSGNEIGATALADLRLLLTDVPFTTIIGGADGGSFESYTVSGTLPDGEYYVVTDFYAANPDIPRDLNLTTTFDQTGIINGLTYEHPAAINTADVCPNNYFIMAKITKSGGTYTIENIGENNFLSQTTAWGGIDVTDAFGEYASAVVTSVDCNGTTISGINNEWMQTIWGEEIIQEETVYYTNAGGTVTIPSQPIFTTLFNGTQYPYTVTGSGTWVDNGDGTQTLNLEYTLDQEGFSPSQWMFDNGFMDTNFYVATLTTP